ncbi:hypothetical protein [Amycolatopsis alba]|nr:hypothetical protein [Amycolatopsis alba]
MAQSRGTSAMPGGFTPMDPVEETIRFAPGDLDHAWEAHALGTYHDAVAALTPQRSQAFQDAYVGALAGLLRADETSVLKSEVLYAFGRRP